MVKQLNLHYIGGIFRAEIYESDGYETVGHPYMAIVLK